jgi:glycosyltransferase involved in cell wall biosynthesis
MDSAFFYILIRSWRAFENFDRCIDSVFEQTYKKYKIIFIDDNSGYTPRQKNYVKNKLKGHIVKFNKQRLYSLRNAYGALYGLRGGKNAVVFNLDGDDWLLSKSCLETVAGVYEKDKKCLLTYGNCLIWDQGKIIGKPPKLLIPYANLPYCEGIIKNNSYRKEPFYPLHPRTWRLWLFKKIHKKDFLRPDGRWLRFAEDQAIFFPMLEMAGGNFATIKKPIYVHNFEHENSDIKRNLLGLVKDELVIRKKPGYEPIF